MNSVQTNTAIKASEPFLVYVNGVAIDVREHYRNIHGMELSEQPTMCGQELRNGHGDTNPTYRLIYEQDRDHPPINVADAQAVVLVPDMHFFTIPNATY